MRFYAIWTKTVILSLVIFVILGIAPKVLLANDLTFSAEKAYEHTKHIVQKIGARPSGSKGELKAAQYIYYVLEQSGWKVREQPFSKVVVQNLPLIHIEPKIGLVSSQNIIAELPGKTRETILIGAHYDSAENSPGAFDNASGVGLLLELARVLGKKSNDVTYQLVFFGAEESGLVGSAYFAKNTDLSAVNWMLNIDMVGTPLEIDFAGKKSAPPELVEKVTNLARQTKLSFHISRDFMVMTRDSNQGGNSDFSSFLEQGIPAVGLGTAGRPAGFYHRPEDQLEQVSLENIQKVGAYVEKLIREVRLSQVGPREWDELFLSFQFASKVLVLPSLVLRLLYLLVLVSTSVMLIRFFRNSQVSVKSLCLSFAVVLPAGFLAIGLSSGGEGLWGLVKESDSIWYAYPGIFLLVRIGLAIGLLLVFGSFLPRLPISRDPKLYWISGVVILTILVLITTSIRVDLAFPFVFWLFCFILQWFYPNLFLALLGPYFFYIFHWELLNSQQWFSFYETVNSHMVIFLIIYGFLFLPMLLAVLHVTCSKPKFWQITLTKIRRPVCILIVLAVLSLGLIPAYTANYPQSLTVREEWLDNGHGQINISSRDKLPKQILRDFQAKPEKTLLLPAFNTEAPIAVEMSIQEKQNRVMNVGLKFDFKREPYMIRLRLESKKPFHITQMEDFVPLAKLPRKVQLEGSERSGQYHLILERTPPHQNNLQFVIAAESTVTCSVETTFLDPPTQLSIKGDNLSVDYQSVYKTKFEF